MKLHTLRLGTRLGLGFGAVLLLMLAFLHFEALNDRFGEVSEQGQRAAMADEWRGQTSLNVSRTLAIAKTGGHAELLTGSC